ncbi:helix-turn-helix protein [Cutibacterium acnes JCM 18918]|nr:helix-turn-helix protein [Cutibacterium acnes JCM 18918]
MKEVLDVDVMKRSGLSTDYSLCIVGRRVVVLNKQFWLVRLGLWPMS